jgi:hypothetical protein
MKKYIPTLAYYFEYKTSVCTLPYKAHIDDTSIERQTNYERKPLDSRPGLWHNLHRQVRPFIAALSY